MTGRLHDDEIPVSAGLVRRLMAEQFPHWAGRAVCALGTSGSTNALYRLGDDLLVRMPRQPGGSRTIAKEARWSPTLAAALSYAVPEVLAVGRPGAGYPECWSVVRWIDAVRVPAVRVDDAVDPRRRWLARDLADLLGQLRALAVPSAAAADPDLREYRGEPIAALDATFRRCVDQCRGMPTLELDLDTAVRVWNEVMRLPDADAVTETWLHGDLLAENVLLRDGRLAAVLDLGGLAVGDPTVDLVVAWELLDAPAREQFRAVLRLDEPTWLRGRAWALALSLMTFPYYGGTMPSRVADRLAMGRAVLADAAGS